MTKAQSLWERVKHVALAVAGAVLVLGPDVTPLVPAQYQHGAGWVLTLVASIARILSGHPTVRVPEDDPPKQKK